MKNILISQLDYTYFVYGLSLLMLGAACLVQLKKDQLKLPWVFLAMFGIVSGLHAWGDLINIVFDDRKHSHDLNVIIPVFSFIFLFEFGRRGISDTENKRTGVWIYVPLILLTGLGGLAGLEGIDAMGRYTLGVSGGFLSCRTLWAAARKGPAAPDRCLMTASIALGLHALLTGTVVHYAPFPPASIINADLFFSISGTPVQTIKTVLAAVIAMSVWMHSENCSRTDDNVFHVKHTHKTVPLIALMAIIIGGWLLAGLLGKHAKHEELRESAVYADAIVSHLQKSPDNVVKSNEIIADFFSEATNHHPESFLVDRKGAIFLSNRPELVSSNLWPDTDKLKTALLPYEPHTGDEIDYQGRHLLVTRRGLRDSDWSLVLFEPTMLIKEYRFFAIVATLVLFSVTFAFFILLQLIRESSSKVVSSERLYRSLVDGSPNFIFLIDEESRCITANKAYLSFFECGLPDISVKGLPDICSIEKGGGDLNSIIKKCLEGKRRSFESTLTGCNERRCTCSSTLSPIYDPDGRIRNIVCIFVDVTAKKEAEKEIEKYHYHLEDLIKERTSELEEANRLLQSEILERIKVEKALRTSEERFHSLFNLASDAILLLDADTEGKEPAIVDANVAASSMHGYTPDELIGKPISFLNAPESLEKAREVSKQLFENPGEVVTFEITHVRKDGSVFPIEVSAKIINLDGKNYILGIDRDISMRKSVEEALRRSQQRFRAVFDNAPVGITIINTDRRFIEANTAFQKMTGYDIAELSELSVSDISHPDDDRLNMLYYEELMAGRLPHFSMEKRFIRKNGAVLLTNIVITTIRDNYDKPVLLFGIVEDITEKKRAEDELRKYHERLEEIIAQRTSELLKINKSLKNEIAERKEIETTLKESEAKLSVLYNEFNIILNSTPDSIVLMSLDKKVLWANKSTENYIDMSAGDPVGKRCHELVHKTDCPIEECYAAKVFETEAPVDFQARNYQGRMLDIRIVPIKDESGKFIKMLHIARDVTEKNRLHETAHLASLGEMAAAVAHEINNPNNVIMFNSSILRDSWGDVGKILHEYSKDHGDFSAGGLPSGTISETVENLIAGIVKSSVRIKNIVGDMRRLSLQDKQTFFEEYDLNTVTENAISLLNMRINKLTKSFSFSAAPDIPILKGNPTQIEQVVINLILNALQALENSDKAVKVSTGYDASSDSALLEVFDEGYGIESAHLGQIMKPFFTTKHEGTGLGLSLVGKILTTHNGKIEFKSESGKGTAVKVTLPVRIPDRKEVKE
ncbi:MAG: PAS domain S-box protein [Nitrospirae bacterium]|nr:MAG: PAS domain S-box protein [Nitrospirota bacterium]